MLDDIVCGAMNGEALPGEVQLKLAPDTLQLLQIAQGSLNEPAYTTWLTMVEFAKNMG